MMKDPKFLKYEEELREMMSSAFSSALMEMGEKAKEIDWYATNKREKT